MLFKDMYIQNTYLGIFLSPAYLKWKKNISLKGGKNLELKSRHTCQSQLQDVIKRLPNDDTDLSIIRLSG